MAASVLGTSFSANTSMSSTASVDSTPVYSICHQGTPWSRRCPSAAAADAGALSTRCNSWGCAKAEVASMSAATDDSESAMSGSCFPGCSLCAIASVRNTCRARQRQPVSAMSAHV